MDGIRQQPPNGGWGWMVVAGAFIIHFFNLGLVRMSGLIYLIVKERFDSTASQTASVMSVFNSVRLLTAPVTSLLCQRLGCRAVGVASGVFLCAGLILASHAPSLWAFLLSYGIVSALGSGMALTSAMIMLSTYFDKKKGLAMGIAVFGSGIGITALAPLTKLIKDAYGYSGTLLILGGLMLQNSLGGAVFRPLYCEPKFAPVVKEAEEEEEEKEEIVDDLRAVKAVARPRSRSDSLIHSIENIMMDEVTLQKLDHVEKEIPVMTDFETEERKKSCCPSVNRMSIKKQLSELRLLFTNSRFLFFGFVLVAYTMSFMGYLTFLPAYTKELGASDDQVALIVSIYGFADMVGCILAAVVIDLPVVRSRRVYFIVTCTLCTGLTTLITPFMPSYYSLAFSVVLNAVFKSGVMSQRITVVSDLVADSLISIAVGCVLAFQGLGNVIGPPLEGWLRDRTGDYKACFYLEGVFLTAATVIFLLADIIRHKTQLVPANPDAVS